MQNHGFQADIAGRIDTMDVAKGRGNGEVAIRDGWESLIDLPDLLRLSVQTGGIHIRVVHTILKSMEKIRQPKQGPNNEDFPPQKNMYTEVIPKK